MSDIYQPWAAWVVKSINYDQTDLQVASKLSGFSVEECEELVEEYSFLNRKSLSRVIDKGSRRDNTYVPENLLGWWGGEDTRVRCIRDDKVVLDNDIAKAKRTAERAEMTIYVGRCGHIHVGHQREDRSRTTR